MEKPNLMRLFSACDVNKSGKIEYEDFTSVCRELSVPETEIQTLFNKFGAQEDGFIDYSKFSSSFQEVFDTGTSLTSWEMFLNKVDVELFLPESLREQLADFYQTIYSSGNQSFLQAYEEIINSLISLSLDNKLECEQLKTNLKRAEEMNSRQLAELEDDIQQQLIKTEKLVRNEEQKKMEGIMVTMQRKHGNEIADLQATMDQLVKSQQESELNQSKEEVIRLNQRIGHLSLENEQLTSSLLQAQTNISILHSEVDKLKNICADQKAQHEREKEELKRMVMEYQSYSNQIQTLQEMNKKLYDSNDGLRSALASEAVAAKRRLSPHNEIPSRRMKPLRQSTLDHSRLEQDSRISHVETWAERYLDSGISLTMDTTESSVSDYDTDDSRGSMETVHHSYSCTPSDMEISEVKSEATVSAAPSRRSSVASSIRRRLSAFSSKVSEDEISAPKQPPPMCRLVLAGDAGTGKSSFLLRLTANEFRGDIQSTLGVDFQMKRMLVDGEMTGLQIWDTAGQERFRSIARSYFRKAHGVLLLYDVTSESSFLSVRAWVDQIQDSTDEKIPMCVIGNKVDLREELTAGQCVSNLHGENLAKAYGALFCETSAKDGTNVVEAVLHLAREVKRNGNLRRQSGSQVKLIPTNSKKNAHSCCGL